MFHDDHGCYDYIDLLPERPCPVVPEELCHFQYHPSPWSERMSESERLERFTETRFKTPRERVASFRSLRYDSRKTPDTLNLFDQPERRGRPISAPVQRPLVPKHTAAPRRKPKAMRFCLWDQVRQRPQSAMTGLWPSVRPRTNSEQRSSCADGTARAQRISQRISLFEGTTRAPESMASPQEANHIHNIDNTSDHGSNDSLMFDLNDQGNLVQLARELSMKIDDVMLVKSVFENYDVDRSGAIDSPEFHKAVEELVHLQGSDQEMDDHKLRIMTENHWNSVAGDRGTLSFEEFARWYRSYGFSEDLLLTSEERWLRRLAKKQGVSPECVTQIKVIFDTYDKDRSGTVDMEEFKQILYMVMKVPQHIGLPMSSVQYFWSQINVDSSGTVTFEEFLCWWMKYFDDSSAQGLKHMPFEDFYKHIRRIGHKFLDPPAYPLSSHNEDDA
mmetsp:Transcript_134154/g.267716  ORF Transcript_134154/g.267716 Transcript_134154/m.267716 type:complete len:445 (-) Transcript_134154:486-1820(-)